VQVGDEIFVKIIDIDLDRRRISLSLKQANEGAVGEITGEDFDPTLYGMPATYDEQGNYVYPDGFDPESGEWLEGFDPQREEWERQYAEARTRFEAHQRQVAEARSKADGEDGDEGDAGSSHTSGSPEESSGGALASDEALAALREKLSGGRN
jgi:small subunit ribosomal protein S1